MIADEKSLKVIDTSIAPASYYLGILGRAYRIFWINADR